MVKKKFFSLIPSNSQDPRIGRSNNRESYRHDRYTIYERFSLGSNARRVSRNLDKACQSGGKFGSMKRRRGKGGEGVNFENFKGREKKARNVG